MAAELDKLCTSLFWTYTWPEGQEPELLFAKSALPDCSQYACFELRGLEEGLAVVRSMQADDPGWVQSFKNAVLDELVAGDFICSVHDRMQQAFVPSPHFENELRLRVFGLSALKTLYADVWPAEAEAVYTERAELRRQWEFKTIRGRADEPRLLELADLSGLLPWLPELEGLRKQQRACPDYQSSPKTRGLLAALEAKHLRASMAVLRSALRQLVDDIGEEERRFAEKVQRPVYLLTQSERRQAAADAAAARAAAAAAAAAAAVAAGAAALELQLAQYLDPPAPVGVASSLVAMYEV